MPWHGQRLASASRGMGGREGELEWGCDRRGSVLVCQEERLCKDRGVGVLEGTGNPRVISAQGEAGQRKEGALRDGEATPHLQLPSGASARWDAGRHGVGWGSRGVSAARAAWWDLETSPRWDPPSRCLSSHALPGDTGHGVTEGRRAGEAGTAHGTQRHHGAEGDVARTLEPGTARPPWTCCGSTQSCPPWSSAHLPSPPVFVPSKEPSTAGWAVVGQSPRQSQAVAPQLPASEP